jgi:hypothetical protein
MSGLPLKLLLLWACLTATANCFAVSVRPQQVQDLHYGEVLFHFYQQDYFTAISHLMVAQRQQQLEHHKDESELLLGGLQLSYGMLNQAEQRFNRLLDDDTSPLVRNRVWYYLTKIAYQRGHYAKAFETLQKIDKPRDKAKRAELAVLNANIHMALGKDEQAADSLKKIKAPDEWEQYLRINRGIAQLRAGNIEQGRETLDKLGKSDADNEELRALRDRANLGLGYQLLRAGDAERAREYLSRVRTQGPYTRSALLGAGWADAERGDYDKALTPWLELLKSPGFEAPVQEAHLAVPYAFGQLGDQQRSIYFYQQAIDYFDQEQQQLDTAINTVQTGEFLSLLSQVDTGVSGGWLRANPTLEGVPSGRYLVDVLAGHDFQESLKDYRDFGYLEQLLNTWLENIGLYYDMVDARRLAYEQRTPMIRERLAKQEAQALQQRWQHYSALIEAQNEKDDPLSLATGKEKQHWKTMQTIEEKLATLPNEARYNNMRDKARWLKGILYWQIQADYRTRLWEARKELNALEAPVNEVIAKQNQVSQALGSVKAGFDGYDKRIQVMRERILSLLPQVQLARNGASGSLQQLALKELEARRQRLVSYRSQARYALARSYDQVAQHSKEQP